MYGNVQPKCLTQRLQTGIKYRSGNHNPIVLYTSGMVLAIPIPYPWFSVLTQETLKYHVVFDNCFQTVFTTDTDAMNFDHDN